MNIKDIAELAGVSRATVSRYLNNGYVSADKKKKIHDVIKQTGYVPSTQAQMLRTKRTCLVGVIIPKINSETVAKITSGISQVLNENHYHMLVANTENSYEKELEYLKIFANDRVDGVILLASVLTKKHIDLIKNMPVPVVVVGQETDVCSCIYHDNYYASRALTEKLLKAGSHRPGFLGVIDADVAAGAMRRQGFEKALREGKLLKKDVSEKVCAFNEQSGYEKMREMLEEDYKPDGVICATDNIAAGAMRAIREAGLRIPDDVKIAAFGDTRLAALVSPAMTTVHFYYEKSGQEAGQMIMDMIRRQDDPVKKVLLEYEIVSRDSL